MHDIQPRGRRISFAISSNSVSSQWRPDAGSDLLAEFIEAAKVLQKQEAIARLAAAKETRRGSGASGQWSHHSHDVLRLADGSNNDAIGRL